MDNGADEGTHIKWSVVTLEKLFGSASSTVSVDMVLQTRIEINNRSITVTPTKRRSGRTDLWRFSTATEECRRLKKMYNTKHVGGDQATWRDSQLLYAVDLTKHVVKATTNLSIFYIYMDVLNNELSFGDPNINYVTSFLRILGQLSAALAQGVVQNPILEDWLNKDVNVLWIRSKQSKAKH